jgi:hypothetical protein
MHQLSAGYKRQIDASQQQLVNPIPDTLLQLALGASVAGPAVFVASSLTGRLDETQAVQQCAAALAAVAETAQHAHVDSTVQTRQRLTLQAASFFERLPSSLEVNLLTAGPEHFLWFAQQEFIKENAGGLIAVALECSVVSSSDTTLPLSTAGTVLPDGSFVVAPSSLNSLFFVLSDGTSKQSENFL